MTTTPRKTAAKRPAAKKAPARKAPAARSGNTGAGRVAGPVITVNAKTVEAIPVLLVGQQYQITPPKTTLALTLARAAQNAEADPEPMFALLDDWLSAAFGEEVGREVLTRMYDPKDRLDFKQIMELVQAVLEYATQDPTG